MKFSFMIFINVWSFHLYVPVPWEAKRIIILVLAFSEARHVVESPRLRVIGREIESNRELYFFWLLSVNYSYPLNFPCMIKPRSRYTDDPLSSGLELVEWLKSTSWWNMASKYGTRFNFQGLNSTLNLSCSMYNMYFYFIFSNYLLWVWSCH